MKINVDKIFIVHWKELIDRRNYLEGVLPEDKTIWVDMYDRRIITENDILRYYSFNDKDTWYGRQNGLYKNILEFRKLRISEVCNSLSHIYCLDYIIDNNINLSLIIEDDVIFKPNFNKFNDLLKNTPDFDLIFIGSSFSIQTLDNVGCENTEPAKLISPGIYEKVRNPKTRTVDSYIINFESAKKIRNIIDKISLPYDFDLAFFIKNLNLKVYWWEPGIISQGSQIGKYKSSIR